jgi:CubicO group peptidase (beta-lactamase class C family)
MEFGPEDVDRTRRALESVMAVHRLPGIAVGVVSSDGLVWSDAFGWADIESRRPQAPELRQRIGSITKTMTALCAMALVEEGRLSLDDRIVDLLPDAQFHGPAEEITVGHVLTHTSGIGEVPNPDDLRSEGMMLWSGEEPDDRRIPEVYPDGITVDVPPGTKWAYANHAFALLGEALMRKEEADIDAVLRRRIFEPLEMGNTDCKDRPHGDLTTPYHRPISEDERELRQRAGMEIPEEPEPVDGINIRGSYQYEMGVPMRAAGAVQSTIPDMARYARALLRGGEGIVRRETFESMVAPQWCPDDRLLSMGLAFMREPRFGRRTFHHGGGVVGGWNTMLTVVPEEDLALLVHLNLSYDKFAQVDGEILRAVLGAPEPADPDVAVDARVLETAPGTYEATPGRLTNFRIVMATGRVTVEAQDGGLVLRSQRGPWKEGARMLPVERDFFVLDTDDPEPPGVAVVLDDDGRVTGLRFDRLVEMVRA